MRKDAVAALGAFYIEWTRIEASLSVMLSVLLLGEMFQTGDEIVAIEIMESCATINERVTCVLAAAKLRLHENQGLLARFREALNGLKESARVRNKLVHGRWTLGPEPDKINHRKQLIGNDRITSYTAGTLEKMLNELELKSDSLSRLFSDEVVPVSEKFLSARRAYFASLKDRKNGA